MLRDVWAFRVIALAALGRAQEARGWFAQARPMLEARRDTDLIKRRREAIPGVQ